MFQDATKIRYELVEVDGMECLFTNSRLDRSTVPETLHCYDVRDSDDCDGTFAQIKKLVFVNHWGTILTKEPLPLDESDAYYPKDTELYSGVELTLEDPDCRNNPLTVDDYLVRRILEAITGRL